MNTNYKFSRSTLVLGLLIGIVIGAIFVLHGLEVLPGGYKYAAISLSISILTIALLFLIFAYFKEAIIKKIFGDINNIDSVLEEGQKFTSNIAKALTETVLNTTNLTFEQKQQTKDFIPRMLSFVIWRNIRNWWFRTLVAIIIAIGGLATTILLVNQNRLLETQNQKIAMQNSLMEAERRSALVIIMSDVIDEIQSEISEQRQEAINYSKDSLNSLAYNGYSLSDLLIGRIAALSQGLLPYQILQGEGLSVGEYSVERGQLLLYLLNSGLSIQTLNKIYAKVTFENSYLVNCKLPGAYLILIDLRNANLQGADLRLASLSSSDLTGAKLISAELRGTTLHGATFKNADLSDAEDLTFDQLTNCKSLENALGLESFEEQLKSKNSCLFDPDGCAMQGRTDYY